MSDTNLGQSIKDKISALSVTDPMAGLIYGRPRSAKVEQQFGPNGAMLTYVSFHNMSGEMKLATVILDNVNLAVTLAKTLNQGGSLAMEYLDSASITALDALSEGNA
jgi:hypothetical protein